MKSKAEIIAEYRLTETDTGSPEVAGRAAHRAHQPPHPAHEREQARLSQQPRPAENGRRRRNLLAYLQKKDVEPLSRPDRAVGSAQITSSERAAGLAGCPFSDFRGIQRFSGKLGALLCAKRRVYC